MKYLTLLLVLLTNQTFSQTFTERELKTKIDEVTIYVQGGQVSRTGKVEIPQGKSILRIKSLSPYIDDKSVQVRVFADKRRKVHYSLNSLLHKQGKCRTKNK